MPSVSTRRESTLSRLRRRPCCVLRVACRRDNSAFSNTQHATRNTKSAFTLFELMVVMAISAIVLAVGVARFGFQSAFTAQNTRIARRLAADLRYAQSEAIAHGKNHYLLFTDNGTKITEYVIYRAEAGGDVAIEPTRTVMPDYVALTGGTARAEFAPGGDALGTYIFQITAPNCDTLQIKVVLATGAVIESVL